MEVVSKVVVNKTDRDRRQGRFEESKTRGYERTEIV